MKQKSSCPYTKSILWLIILSGIPSVYVKRWINAWFNIFFKIISFYPKWIGGKNQSNHFCKLTTTSYYSATKWEIFFGKLFRSHPASRAMFKSLPFLHCLAKIQSKPALIFDKNINYFLHSYVSFKKNHHKTLWNSIYDL